MLRNKIKGITGGAALAVLNEVLSLNAQESRRRLKATSLTALLNEVLSLNAQEWFFQDGCSMCSFLNEVLSLNAQESLLSLGSI